MDFSNFPLKSITPQFVVHYQNLVLDEVSEGYATCKTRVLLWVVSFPDRARQKMGLVNCLFHFRSSAPECWRIVLF